MVCRAPRDLTLSVAAAIAALVAPLSALGNPPDAPLVPLAAPAAPAASLPVAPPGPPASPHAAPPAHPARPSAPPGRHRRGSTATRSFAPRTPGRLHATTAHRAPARPSAEPAVACGHAPFLTPFEAPLALRSAYRGATPGIFQFCPSWSGFGLVRGATRNHWGFDLSAPTGTPVRAAADGTLSYARDPNGYGFHARLRLSTPSRRGPGGTCGGSEEIEILYAHLIDDGKTPTATRAVRAGEIVGRVGCSGNAHGMCSPSPESHLHVTVQKFPTKEKFEPGVFLGWNILTPTDHPLGWGVCGRLPGSH